MRPLGLGHPLFGRWVNASDLHSIISDLDTLAINADRNREYVIITADMARQLAQALRYHEADLSERETEVGQQVATAEHEASERIGELRSFVEGMAKSARQIVDRLEPVTKAADDLLAAAKRATDG